jgi:PAS domain S-box-containing protein
MNGTGMTEGRGAIRDRLTMPLRWKTLMAVRAALVGSTVSGILYTALARIRAGRRGFAAGGSRHGSGESCPLARAAIVPYAPSPEIHLRGFARVERLWRAVQAVLGEKKPSRAVHPIATATGDKTRAWAQDRCAIPLAGDPEALEAFVSGIAGPGRADETLSKTPEELEALAGARTAELAAANRALQEEIAYRRRAEQSVRDSEERLRTIIDASKEAMVAIDVRGLITFFNPAAERMFGLPAAGMIGQPLDRLMPVAFRKQHQQHVRRFFETGRPNNAIDRVTELPALRSDGSEFPIELSLSAGHRGDDRFVLAVMRDITERTRTEQALRDSEAKYRILFESSSDAIVLLDESGFIDCNGATLEMFGLTEKKELISRHPADLSPPQQPDGEDSVAAANYRITQAFSAGWCAFEWVHRRKSGQDFPAEVWLTTSQLGERTVLQASIRDLTERKRAENAMRRAHAQTQELLAAIPSILISVDQNGSVLQWNATAESTLGVRAEAVIGRPLRQCGIRWDWAPVLQAVAECRATNAPQRGDDVRFTRADGKEGFLSIMVSPIKSEAGTASGVLLVGVDITERRLLQTQLAHAQKLESIGQLAAGIAHEINTPIQFVGDNTRFLQDAFRDLQQLLEKESRLLEACGRNAITPELIAEVDAAVKAADLGYLSTEVPKAIEQSLDGIARVAKIVRAMKEFSHPGGEEKKAVDLNKAIETTITVARNEWKYVADVQTRFDPSLPAVPCLPGEFNQVILNLIINAAHAIADVVGDGSQDKGTITVSTRHQDGWAEVRVSDTGTGIPEAVRSRIFDPFFTTKPVGKGTGQGLAIAHAVVVEKHGGTISFETELGRGTTFIIRLPIAHEAAETTAPSTEHAFAAT